MTHKTTRQIIEEKLEQEMAWHTQASKMLDVVLKHNGKKYSKRLLPDFAAAAGEPVYYSNTYGNPQIATASYHSTRGMRGVLFYIGHGDGCPVLDYEAIADSNARYLKAAAERINERHEKLATSWPEIVDLRLDAVAEAKKELRAILADYSADRHAIGQDLDD